jgi:hypothetical protein
VRFHKTRSATVDNPFQVPCLDRFHNNRSMWSTYFKVSVQLQGLVFMNRAQEKKMNSHLLGRQHPSSSDPPNMSEPVISLPWRIVQSMLCVIGGLTFLFGSIQYFPHIDHPRLGGGLFTIGAGGFMIADCMEVYAINNFQCCRSSEEGNVMERTSDSYNVIQKDAREPKLSICSKLFSTEESVNGMLTAFGSTFYFVGSVLFNPVLKEEVVGDIMFIPGSVLLFFAMVWKMYRSGLEPLALDNSDNRDIGQVHRNVLQSRQSSANRSSTDNSSKINDNRLYSSISNDIISGGGNTNRFDDSENGSTFDFTETDKPAAAINSKRHFSWERLCASDRLVLAADLSLCVGALLFWGGSILYLPQFVKYESLEVAATIAFVIGSVLFTICGLCVFTKFFCV